MMKTTRAAAAGFLALSLSGCLSTENQDYAIPDPFCQAKGVEASAVKPLLPAGKDLHLYIRDLTSEPDNSQVCVVLIDKKRSMRINTLRNEANIDALHYAVEGAHPFENPQPVKIPGVASTAVGEDGALLSMQCASPKDGYLVVTLRLDTTNKPTKGPVERRESIENFLKSYIPNLIKSKCAA
ncbi:MULTISPECIES: hypothetical protein [Streptomyces]|uniref:DUF3558 domain-containing protein n=1 Tax=Streptomyces sudanensis TaxID=436397 RepID=A0ABY4TFZ5_9ACTN|nr:MULTISPECIES: hypothetical protein [Streptomyces]MCP9986224.1 hypothetical protein [Streptomyces sudanensis]URN17829.1 hypothetical protein MW084_19950 [Streptomyces sudanensis]